MNAVNRMKLEKKAAGASERNMEMIVATGEIEVEVIMELRYRVA